MISMRMKVGKNINFPRAKNNNVRYIRNHMRTKYIAMFVWLIFAIFAYFIFHPAAGVLVDTQLALNAVNGSNLDFAAREGAKRAAFLYPIVAVASTLLGTWGIAKFWPLRR